MSESLKDHKQCPYFGLPWTSWDLGFAPSLDFTKEGAGERSLQSRGKEKSLPFPMLTSPLPATSGRSEEVSGMSEDWSHSTLLVPGFSSGSVFCRRLPPPRTVNSLRAETHLPHLTATDQGRRKHLLTEICL